MDPVWLLVGVVVGVLVGFRARKWASAGEAQGGRVEAEMLREEAERLRNDLTASRDAAGTAERAEAAATAALLAAREETASVRSQLDQTSTRLDNEVRQRSDLATDLAALRTTLAERERNLREQQEALQKAREALRTEFEATGAKVLTTAAEALMKQTKEQMESQKKLSDQDLEARQKAIDATLKPLQEQLQKQEKLVQELGQKREGDAKTLGEQLRQIAELQQQASSAAQMISGALRDNRQRGRWGEVALRSVVELAGLAPGVHFTEQQSLNTEEGRLRPDMVVKLPGGRSIAIDSKVPLSGYLESIDTGKSDAERAAARDAHASALRTHVRTLHSRGYADAVPGEVEFVVLFIPIESAFTAAFESDPTIHADAMDRKVLVVTPSTLLALLRTVALHWSNASLAQNAQRIAEEAKEFLRRVHTFADHFANVGKRLQAATASYNQAVGSFGARLLPSVNKVADMTAGTPLEALEGVDAIPRALGLPAPRAGDEAETDDESAEQSLA